MKIMIFLEQFIFYLILRFIVELIFEFNISLGDVGR